ncbi:hypothetical protein [Algibacter sp. L4_22]|uniref:hypothetical protein n=1 Tax=Algibacter sp. L4_22 TaxID=2942477 RepID=UPI00201B8D1C|nr:hypothetical protein [Algibacter sp. L4_22]MCL5129150.1 hypothetical protein [Algibacter sp. L4_22]
MAFETLKKDLVDLDSDMRSYIETNKAYYKLKVFKILIGSITTITHSLLIGAIVFLAIFMISLGISMLISEAIGNLYSGFLIVGAFYLVVAIGCYIFRSRLNRPLIKKFSKHYFDSYE